MTVPLIEHCDRAGCSRMFAACATSTGRRGVAFWHACRNACTCGRAGTGLDVDKAEARRYYTLIFVRCPNGKLNEKYLEYAKKWLRDNGADETVL